MIVFAVALVLTGLVVAVILVSAAFRDTAFCPRREALVEIVEGRCRERETCPAAPLGCERACIKLSDFAARAA